MLRSRPHLQVGIFAERKYYLFQHYIQEFEGTLVFSNKQLMLLIEINKKVDLYF